MSGNGGVYAARRRKKPVQKIKPPPVKTNPSKRHRDRLNVELDHLTSLLPFSEEVRGRLDKLSVLRLSVGYLKVKSYFNASLQKRSASPVSTNGRSGHSVSQDGVRFSEQELLLKALNGFVLVVTTDGMVFYVSQTIQDFLGFHQSDVVHQDIHNLIHMDDREMFRCQLHFSLNPSKSDSDTRAQNGQSSSKTTMSLLPQHIPPENSSFLERSFCCRLRCLLDNTSGFLALNFNGRLKYLHLQQNAGADGSTAPPQLALFAVATPLDPPSVMEIRTKTLIFQTKHRMDFAPMGIDTRGKLVLGYSEIELVTTGSGYQFIHAADMMYCADNHLKMMKTGDSGFTFFRLLTKTGHWLWVQASARVVFKGGRPDFIIARQKALTNEEGEEHLRQRRQQLPFTLTTGEGVLYDTWMDAFSMPGPPGSQAPDATEPTAEEPLDPASLLGSLRRQGQSIYTHPQMPNPQLPVFPQIEDVDLEQPQSSIEHAFLDSHALLSVPGQTQPPQQTSGTGDLTAEAMIKSLEQILGDIGDGGLEGVQVEETELKEWESTLKRMNQERTDTSEELNRILANDVFSYVEEALGRDTCGFVQGSNEAGAHTSESILLIQGGHHDSVFSNNEQPTTDLRSGIREQTAFGDVLCGVGCSTGERDTSAVVSHTGAHTQTPTQCHNTHPGLWPSSSSAHHSGNQMISSQPCHTHHSQPGTTPQSGLPSVRNTNNSYSSCKSGSVLTDRSVQNTPHHTDKVPLLQSPSVWQRPQLPESFHQRTATHCLHTPGSLNPTVSFYQPQKQSSSGSCMYEKGKGHIANSATAPDRQNGALLGPTCSRGPTHATRTAPNAPFTLSHPDTAVLDQGMMQPSDCHMAACTDVGNFSLVHLNSDNTGLGSAQTGYPPENGSFQSSIYCWNSEAQITKVPLNGVVNPFAFPALPSGTINLSQNTGP